MKYIQRVGITLLFYVSLLSMELPSRVRSDSNSSDETVIENWLGQSSIDREKTPPLAQVRHTIIQDSTRVFVGPENKKSWHLPMIVVGILSFSCIVGSVSKPAICLPMYMHNSMHAGSNITNSSGIHAYMPCIDFNQNMTQSLRGFKK